MGWEQLGIDISRLRGNKTLCPKCSHLRKKKNDPCLSVDLKNGVFKCWNGDCGFHGSIHERKDSLKTERKIYNIPEPKYSDLSEKTIYWFRKREITLGTLKHFGIKESQEYMFEKIDSKGVKHDAGKRTCINFPYFRNDDVVNIKYRDALKCFKLVSNAELIFYNLNAIKDEKKIVIVEGECFTENCEVLTENNSWIKIKDWKDERIAQYNESGQIEFVLPLLKIEKEYKGNLIEFSNEQRFYSLTTEKHNLVLQKGNKIKKVEAKHLKNSSWQIPRTAKHNGKGINLTDDEIRLCIAVSADFSLRKEGDIYGAFKKERKKERICKILDNLKIKYSCNLDKRNYYSVFMRRGEAPKYLFKKFPLEWISQSTQEQKKLIIEEILFWDGNSVPNRKQIEYSTKEIHNATFIQTISHLCGYCSTIIPRENKFGKWFKVSILFTKTHTSTQSITQRKNKKTIEHNGLVYCFKVPSGMLFVRQNNCISVNGNCDVLAMYEAGVLNCVSVPNGASKGSKLEYLDNCYEYFENAEEIILATDNDVAGLGLKEELLRRFGSEKCSYVDFKECKDPNEYLVKYGKEELKKVVDSSMKYPIDGLQDVDDFIDEITHYYHNGYPKGHKVGFAEFDELITWAEAELTTVTGVPSSGKSNFVDQICTLLSMNFGWKFAIFSPENRPSIHISKMCAQFVGKSFNNSYQKMSQDELNKGLKFYKEFYKFYNYENVFTDIDSILDLARKLIFRNGINALVLDPYNNIEHLIPNGQTETQYINTFLTKLRRFKDKHKVHIILVAHPKKIEKENGKFRVPTLYDIAGSAHFFNKTDNGITVYRDLETNVVTVFVQKIRFSHRGKIGSVDFDFDKTTFRYKEQGKGEYITPIELLYEKRTEIDLEKPPF